MFVEKSYFPQPSGQPLVDTNNTYSPAIAGNLTTHPEDPSSLSPSPLTYVEHVAAGRIVLEAALDNELVFGAEIASDGYREAAGHLLAAIGCTPLDETGKPTGADPMLLLGYGVALTRQLKGNAVTPYKGTHHASAFQNRERSFVKIARMSFHTAFRELRDDVTDNQKFVDVARISAEELEQLGDKQTARLLLIEARESLNDNKAMASLEKIDSFFMLDLESKEEFVADTLPPLIAESYEDLVRAA